MESGSHQSKGQSQSPPTTGNDTGNEPVHDDRHDSGRGGRHDTQEDHHQRGIQQHDTPERPKSPAYVAPIPKIGRIAPVSPSTPISTTDRPELPSFVGARLVGKLVDEDGDVVDEKTGQLLAHAAGDLPSMIGRRVSNIQGDILGDDGELLGYVVDVERPKTQPPPAMQPRSLADLMGRATSSLMVDQSGNILDSTGKVVGKFHDNNNPLHRKEKEEREKEAIRARPDSRERPPGEDAEKQVPEQPQPLPQSPSTPSDARPQPRRTEEERRQNAEAWRKENPNESPSDIFLDVKSTREGIQLTIRIPTVFNGQQTTPHISFS